MFALITLCLVVRYGCAKLLPVSAKNSLFLNTSLFVFFSESSVLQLDETGGKVRAVPEKRCVLILREIPKNTPEKVRISVRVDVL